MGTGQDTTHMLHVTADATRIYATNVDSGSVSLYRRVVRQPTVPPTGDPPAGARPRADWAQHVLEVGVGAEGFDVSPDGRELWTATPDGHIVIIDLETEAEAEAVVFDARVPGAHRLLFTPDGRRVMVASVSTGDLTVLDAGVAPGDDAHPDGPCASMMMDAEGKRLFVACTPDNVIVVVDLETLKIVERLDIGGRPDGLAIAVQNSDG